MSEAAASLLLTGVLLAGVLTAQAVAVRHLSPGDVPSVLRGRVALSNHVRPWLLVAAAAMVLAGLGLAVQ